MITGLLQTPEYARASVANFPGDHPQAIAKRLDRQAALYNPARRFTFILTEAAVRWQLCEPQVMAVQMGRLASLSELPNICLGVIPLDVHGPVRPRTRLGCPTGRQAQGKPSVSPARAVFPRSAVRRPAVSRTVQGLARQEA